MSKKLETAARIAADLAEERAIAAAEQEEHEEEVDAIHEIEEAIDAENEAEEGEQEREVHSVVGAKYKARYAERAAAMHRKPKDVPAKALKRSTNDWLAIELAKRTLDKKAHLSVPDFEAILDANGVKHAHWNRTTPGWQGRLRMTGRLALARVVAEAGELRLPSEAAIPAPKTWVAKHLH